MKMYEKHQILRQRQITLKQIKCLTSSSLWFLMPRTKSCRFLSNIRSMLPFTIFRAIMLSLLSYRTEPQTRALCEHWPAARVLVSHSVPNSGLCRRAFALSVSADLQQTSVGNGWQNGGPITWLANPSTLRRDATHCDAFRCLWF